MHFLTLATVEIEATLEDKQTDALIEKTISEIKEQKQANPDNSMLNLLLHRYNNLRTSFSRSVNSAIDELLEPYCESTENPDYLEFEDRTDDLHDAYETQKIDCIRLAQGKILSVNDVFIWDRFMIHDGKVYETNSGPLKLAKRTRKAKRMKALPQYPLKKLYPTFQKYVEDGCGYTYDEEQGGYGYFYNPNSFYDWYSIGGRWRNLFLVKTSCKEYSVGEKSWACGNEEPKAPEGYIWVCAARKKDIEWQTMRDWLNKEEAERFAKFEQFFLEGRGDDHFYGKFVEDGITYFGKYLYRKDETLDEYLLRYGVPETYRYPMFAHDFINDEGLHSKSDLSWDNDVEIEQEQENVWHTVLDTYIDSIADETVIVGVDYHI